MTIGRGCEKGGLKSAEIGRGMKGFELCLLGDTPGGVWMWDENFPKLRMLEGRPVLLRRSAC